MPDPLALLWFPFAVDGMLANCDPLQHLAVASHANFSNSLYVSKGMLTEEDLHIQLQASN